MNGVADGYGGQVQGREASNAGRVNDPHNEGRELRDGEREREPKGRLELAGHEALSLARIAKVSRTTNRMRFRLATLLAP